MLLSAQPRKEKCKRFEVSIWTDLICHSRSLFLDHKVRKNLKISTFQVFPQPANTSHLDLHDHHGERPAVGGGGKGSGSQLWLFFLDM